MCPKGKISASGPHLPTWALQHVGSFLGYTGHQIDVVVTAVRDPKLSKATLNGISLAFRYLDRLIIVAGSKAGMGAISK
jgi:hypothetical protein